MDTDPTQRAKEIFANDHFATKTTGIVIDEVTDEYARCHLDIDERHMNAMDNVMGGVIFTLCDFTFAILSNRSEMSSVAVSSTIEYLRPGKGPVLYSEARALKDGRNVCFYEVAITDGDGKAIAHCISNGFRVKA